MSLTYLSISCPDLRAEQTQCPLPVAARIWTELMALPTPSVLAILRTYPGLDTSLQKNQLAELGLAGPDSDSCHVEVELQVCLLLVPLGIHIQVSLVLPSQMLFPAIVRGTRNAVKASR